MKRNHTLLCWLVSLCLLLALLPIPVRADSAPLTGDADGNGTVNNVDAMVLLQYSVGLKREDEINLAVSDVDANGVANNLDAMIVLQYSVGLRGGFPADGYIEEPGIPEEPEDTPLVTDAFHTHAPSATVDGGIHFYIPGVNLPDNRAADANNTIYNALYGYTTTELTYSWGLNYLWTQDEDVISILVRYGGSVYSSLMDQYHTYNVSYETGELLDTAALMEIYGFTMEEYYTLLHQLIDIYYDGLNLDFPDYYMEFVLEQIAKTHSDENLQAAMPFIDQSGDLCVMIKAYTFAGADYLYIALNLTGDSVVTIPDNALHDQACLDGTWSTFLECGCFYPYLGAGAVPDGYTTLDINNDGITELLLDMGYLSQEFHDHLVFTTDASGQLSLLDTLYTFHCMSYSETMNALGYIYPRNSGLTLYHCTRLEDGILYESHTLYHDHLEEIYIVDEFDIEGNHIRHSENAQAEYEELFTSFEPIQWYALPVE